MVLILKITRHYRDVRCGTSGISISQENTKSRSSGTKGIQVTLTKSFANTYKENKLDTLRKDQIGARVNYTSKHT